MLPTSFFPPWSLDCSVCDASYTSSLNFVCVPCTARKWGIAMAGIACGIGLVVGIAVVFHLLSPNVSGSGGNFVDRLARFVPFQSIKIIIVAWQIVTQVRMKGLGEVRIIRSNNMVCLPLKTRLG